MSNKRAQLGIIFLTIFIDLVGFGIVIPVLPRYAEHFGATTMQIGWLVGIFSLMQFFGAPLWGGLSDRIGRRPVLVVSVLGNAFGFFLMGYAGGVAMLIIARAISGISGGNISTAQAYIADITKPEERSKAMGLIGAAFGLGFIFGPAIGGWTSSHYGFAAPMFLAAWLAVANAVLIVCILPESLNAEDRSRKAGLPKQHLFPGLFKHMQRDIFGAAALTYFFTIAGFSIMNTLFALFLWHRFSLDEKHTGYLFALIGTISAVVQGGLIGRLSKRFGDARLASAGAASLALSFLLMPLCPEIPWVIAVTCLVALGNSLTSPTLTAIASRSIDADWQGRALGVFQALGSLARWLGPLMGGWMLSFDLAKPQTDYSRSALWAASLLLVVAVVCSLRLRQAGRRDQPGG